MGRKGGSVMAMIIAVDVTKSVRSPIDPIES